LGGLPPGAESGIVVATGQPSPGAESGSNARPLKKVGGSRSSSPAFRPPKAPPPLHVKKSRSPGRPDTRNTIPEASSMVQQHYEERRVEEILGQPSPGRPGTPNTIPEASSGVPEEIWQEWKKAHGPWHSDRAVEETWNQPSPGRPDTPNTIPEASSGADEERTKAHEEVRWEEWDKAHGPWPGDCAVEETWGQPSPGRPDTPNTIPEASAEGSSKQVATSSTSPRQPSNPPAQPRSEGSRSPRRGASPDRGSSGVPRNSHASSWSSEANGLLTGLIAYVWSNNE
jgi:hypothetical protein